MSNFMDMLNDSPPAEEQPDAEEEVKGDPETPDPETPETETKEEGASAEVNPPQDETPSKDGEEKPPEAPSAPSTLNIGDKEYPIKEVQETFEKAKELASQAKEIEKYKKAYEDSLTDLADPAKFFDLARMIYTAKFGEEKGDEILHKIAENYMVSRFEWLNKPEAERKAALLQRQLDETTKKLTEREQRDTSEAHSRQVKSEQDRILREIGPIAQAEGLNDFRMEGVLEPVQLVLDAMHACHVAGEKPDIAHVVKEVKNALSQVHAGLKTKVTLADLEGREDLKEELRKADLAKVKEQRRAKTVARPEAATAPAKGVRRLIPASKFDEALRD